MTKNKNSELERQVADEVDQGSATSIKPQGTLQDYNQLRRECLAVGKLFEDPEFPAQDSSVYYSNKPDKVIEWKRPTEITSDPKLYIDGFSRFDLNQGDLSDCWFITALANLAMHPKLFLQVVPEDQSFEVNYAGIFHFRFWQYGKWVDVVIDDRLPTNDGKLMYLGSPESKEFWGALVEKAYAKLHGSYEALVDGMGYEAMEDFTGGISEMYDMDAIPANLFTMLLEAQKRDSLMGCLTERVSNQTESKTPQGLITWHAYSITDVKYVAKKKSSPTERFLLLRLRNPWGNQDEWNREWSDESPEWRRIPDSERDKLDLKFDSDGEFWMTFRDFKRYFTSVDICNLSPDSLTDPNPAQRKWEMSAVEGKWVRGVSAGGCNNFQDTFWQNPQYRITLDHPDEGDGKCAMIVSLSQKNRRAQKWKGIDKLHIGFSVYYLRNPNTLPNPLDENFFTENGEVGGTPMFLTNRGANCRFKLSPGVYCIIPSTFEPHDEGEFLLRVFSDSKNTNMKEYNKQLGDENLGPKNHVTEEEVDTNNNSDDDLDPQNYGAEENHEPEEDLGTKTYDVQENVDIKNYDAEEEVAIKDHVAEEDLNTENHDTTEGDLNTKNYGVEEKVDTENYRSEKDVDSENHDVEENFDTRTYGIEEEVETKDRGDEENLDTENHDAEESLGTENHGPKTDRDKKNRHTEEDLNTKTYGLEENSDTNNYGAEENVDTKNYGAKSDVDTKMHSVAKNTDNKKYDAEKDLQVKTYDAEDSHAKNNIAQD